MNLKDLHNRIFAIGRITPSGVNLLGTCFMLNVKGLFATAAHVPNNDDNNLVLFTSKQTELSGYQDTSDNNGHLLQVKIFKVDPVRDICILKLDQETLFTISIGGADDLSVADTVGIVGFPHCVNGRHILTFQSTVIGAKVLIESSGIKSKHLVLNIQTRPGQSGSPIFRLTDSKLVGMIIGSYVPKSSGSISIGGIDPMTLHQTTHAVSTEYILNMI